jgi:hypothetical protein
MTVSGLTITSTVRHWSQARENQTQSSRSKPRQATATRVGPFKYVELVA